MASITQDRLVRKEVALGVVREYEPPQGHIGLSEIAPFLNVQSDDVIFAYTRGLTAGLAPARAEDAESELAQKDESVGTGRASIIDWALKDHYDPSDVSRYRETLVYGDTAAQSSIGSLPLTIDSIREGFESKLARDTALRRRKLDNRLEWLIMTGLQDSTIVYNDGRIKFTIDYGRPANQTLEAPPGGLWSLTTSDPIGDINAMKNFMFDTYGVTMSRGILSRKILLAAANSSKFTNSLIGANPLYSVTGWGPQAALEIISQQTGVQFSVYDSVYRTRAIGSNTTINTRFTRDDTITFLPSEEDVAEFTENEIGFAKTLTSPHPEGNWTPGYYEWEKDTGPDPWGQDFGAGIKAFPVFLHLDKTYTMTVL